ncbi:MAG: crossover junction endodeoxyribonuclease RuvC [Bacteroidales bacterium]|nr:crossover junction endodeoxyribonuclease RuvC [Bacteroidales bacterium]
MTIKRRILGIDPGTNVMGYSILDVEGNRAQVVILGTVQMGRVADHYERLKRIYERINVIIKEFKPDELAIEAPFCGKNVQTMLKLGRAQGICMAAALAHGIPVAEYAPLRVKQAITGNGSASKEQVAAMLKKMLAFAEIPKFLDATDALAIAYCHFLASQLKAAIGDADKQAGGVKIPKPRGKSASWEDFVKQNPGRVKIS